MDLQIALKGISDAETELRSKDGISNPSFISTQMQRLAQYAAAVEERLAELEEEYEVDMSVELKKLIIDEGKSATAADSFVRMRLGPTKGRIAYLTRRVKTAWKVTGICQSRYRHLEAEAGLGKHVI